MSSSPEPQQEERKETNEAERRIRALYCTVTLATVLVGAVALREEIQNVCESIGVWAKKKPVEVHVENGKHPARGPAVDPDSVSATVEETEEANEASPDAAPIEEVDLENRKKESELVNYLRVNWKNVLTRSGVIQTKEMYELEDGRIIVNIGGMWYAVVIPEEERAMERIIYDVLTQPSNDDSVIELKYIDRFRFSNNYRPVTIRNLLGSDLR